jgi:hypothetical protein
VGKLIMAWKLPERFRKLMAEAREEHCPLYKVEEREYFLLGSWIPLPRRLGKTDCKTTRSIWFLWESKRTSHIGVQWQQRSRPCWGKHEAGRELRGQAPRAKRYFFPGTIPSKGTPRGGLAAESLRASGASTFF